MFKVDTPDIAYLVPHSGPMILLDELLEVEPESVRCGLTVREDGLFDSKGAVSALLGIEYMAQTVAAYSGYEEWRRGRSAKVGFLLGTRKFVTSAASFRVGQYLEVRAERVIHGSSGMAAFECRVSGEGIEQLATLSVFEPDESDTRMIFDRE